ncbi:MAG: type II secretion system F family protein [Calditrichaeota bacterium]|nr:type II secretion system F family protein [Candidatus Cloacimonadota bacterium]MCA9787600.1 type II secretion system F family protein [Candidatus Cloacimonadota bacterium]MCB1047250.1 type II secretion system F family protein [Calditrichota bacterium]MCB9472451.1 type II secretion system F family protein [Candidatus Delongbacteria bacterium]
MPTFNYVIRNAAGERIEAEMRAATMEAAIESLRSQGTLVSLKERKVGESTQVTVLDKINLAFERVKQHIPLRSLVFFTRQLSTMFSAGLTLEKSIGNLAISETNKKFRRTLEAVNSEIKRGVQLSDAMSHYPYHFDSLYVALVKAGEVSGSLHTVLKDLADYLENVEDTRQKVKGALYYPVIMMVILGLALLILLWKIIPQFSDIYASLGASLPAPTLALVAMSNIVANNFIIVMLGTFSALFFLWVLTLTDRGELIWDQMKLKIPVFGNLIYLNLLNKYAKTLGILFASGVTVTEALKLVKAVMENRIMAGAVEDIQDMLKDGYSLSVAMTRTGVFPPIMLQLTQTGEESGELDGLLAKASEFYQKQVDSMIERLTSLIEPIIIVAVGLIIGAIVIVIYLPIFDFGQAVQSLGY